MLLSSTNVQLKSLQSMQTFWTFLKPSKTSVFNTLMEVRTVHPGCAYGNFCNHRFMIPFIGLFFSAANGHSSHEAGGSRLYNEKDRVCLVQGGVTRQFFEKRWSSLKFRIIPLHCLPNIHCFFLQASCGSWANIWDIEMGFHWHCEIPGIMLAYQNTLKSMTTDASILKLHKTKTSNLKNHNL